MTSTTSSYSRWRIGDEVEIFHTISEKDVLDFVQLTGDRNPIHVDRKFASTTSLSGPVVHGMLSASFISTIIGMNVPGPGALWISQTLDFKAPARIGDKIQVVATVCGKSDSLRILELDMKVFNQNRILLISGKSKVKVLEHTPDVPSCVELILPVVLISGASKGIGAAIAIKFAAAGYPVAINYRSSATDALYVLQQVDELKSKGKAAIFKADISDIHQVKQMVNDIEAQLGDVGVLINNACGAIYARKFSELEWTDIQTHIDTQVKGVFNLSRAVIPSMELKGRGRIINISSIYADGPPPVNNYDYVIAKSAMASFTKCLAVEFGPKGIHVNNIAPGMTLTSLLSEIPEKTKLVTKMQTPLRRLGSANDVANVALMLAGEAGDYITGETIRVCGGQKMI